MFVCQKADLNGSVVTKGWRPFSTIPQKVKYRKEQFLFGICL